MAEDTNKLKQEKRALEERLKATEEELQVVLDGLKEGLLLLDEDFRVLRINRPALKLIGIDTKEDVLGKECYRLMHNTEEPPGHCPLLETKRTARPASSSFFEPYLQRHITVSVTPIETKDPQKRYYLHSICDTTRENSLKEELTNTKDTLSAVLESSPYPLVVILPDYTIKYINPEAETFIGRPRHEVTGKHCYEVVFQRDVICDDCLMEEAINRRGPIQDEKTVQLPDGRKRHFQRTIYPVTTPEGKVHCLVEVFNDLTELKENQEALERHERFLNSVLEGIGDAVLVIGPDLKVLRANRGFLSQTGLTHEEVPGRHCYELSHGYRRACYEEGEDCPVVKAFQDGMAHFSVHTHRRNDGSPFYVEVRAFPLKDTEGRTTAVVETVTDITTKVHLQEKLRQSEARYRQLYNSAPALLLSTTTEGIIIECNDTFCRVTGYDRETLKGMAFVDLVPEPARPDFLRECQMVIKEEQDCEGEFEITRADGKTLSVYAKATLVRDPEGRPLRISFTLTDITALKKLQAERDQLQMQLFQAQKMESLGKLASGIAHDFNNMLMAIGGYAEILRHHAKAPEIERPIEGILKTVERARELTEKILFIGRKKVPERKLTDINQFIKDSFGTLRRMVEENKTLKLKLTEGLPPVNADEGQLYQVLMNLVINARDAISGSGTITIKTGHSPGPCLQDKPYICILHSENRPGGGFVWFSVEDTGTGIPPEDLPKIFDPFFSTKGPQGTGLGLSVVYSIVQAHEGCIDVYTRPGQGTEVVVLLPVAEAHEEKRPPEEQKEIKVEGPVEIKKTLVVDDEEVIRDV
ncbi:MAG: PAS domain-containing sensor histidine kinase, partial [Nitrospirae bacterium]